LHNPLEDLKKEEYVIKANEFNEFATDIRNLLNELSDNIKNESFFDDNGRDQLLKDVACLKDNFIINVETFKKVVKTVC
jgi:hypothetical protein